MDRVLDAGCGFGHWSIQLSELNHTIHATDVDEARLCFLQTLSEKMGKGIDVDWAKISALHVEDKYFNGIFCYSAIYTDDWRNSLREFHRVLRKDGRAYFNFNSIGWYVNLWMNRPKESENYDPRASAAEAISNTVEYELGNSEIAGSKIISEEEVADAMEEIGFSEWRLGAEGTLTVNPEFNPTPSFPELDTGLPGVIATLCVK